MPLLVARNSLYSRALDAVRKRPIRHISSQIADPFWRGARCGKEPANLLAAAEEEISRRGCDQVALSTHSFQAPAFYARFGYAECGRTPAYPRGHDQIHLVRRFS